MAPKAYVVPSPGRGVSPRFVALCETWAREVGWELAGSVGEAEAVILGPGADAPEFEGPQYRTVDARGVDGFRWAIRHAAYTEAWPPETISYGPLDDHVADVRSPGAGAPVAVVLHGGFWLAEWHRDLMDGIAVDLARRGWTTWNVEYRRTGNGGGWPQTKDDVVAAVKQAAAASPTGRVALVGHSAGGHLALMSAAELGNDVVDSVLSLAGVCDMVLAASDARAGRPARRFLGSRPAAEADPRGRVPLSIRTLLVHPLHDEIVPIELSRRYAEAAREANDDVTLLELPEGDHMSVVEPQGGWPEAAALLG